MRDLWLVRKIVENEWDQIAKADMVEGPVEEVTYEEVMEAMNKMKLGKAAGSSEVNIDTIMASAKFGWKRYARRMENKCRCSNL